MWIAPNNRAPQNQQIHIRSKEARKRLIRSAYYGLIFVKRRVEQHWDARDGFKFPDGSTLPYFLIRAEIVKLDRKKQVALVVPGKAFVQKFTATPFLTCGQATVVPSQS